MVRPWDTLQFDKINVIFGLIFKFHSVALACVESYCNFVENFVSEQFKLRDQRLIQDL